MCKFLDFMDSPSYTLKKWPLDNFSSKIGPVMTLYCIQGRYILKRKNCSVWLCSYSRKNSKHANQFQYEITNSGFFPKVTIFPTWKNFSFNTLYLLSYYVEMK